MINVDVSHTTFWAESSFELIVLQLCGLDKNPAGGFDGLQVRWRREKGAQRDNYIFLAMKRLKRNCFTVKHGNRAEKEGKSCSFGLCPTIAYRFLLQWTKNT